jgi:hypothetical protein
VKLALSSTCDTAPARLRRWIAVALSSADSTVVTLRAASESDPTTTAVATYMVKK